VKLLRRQQPASRQQTNHSKRNEEVATVLAAFTSRLYKLMLALQRQADSFREDVIQTTPTNNKAALSYSTATHWLLLDMSAFKQASCCTVATSEALHPQMKAASMLQQRGGRHSIVVGRMSAW